MFDSEDPIKRVPNSCQRQQNYPPLWVAENRTTYPLPRAQKLITQLISAPTHSPPLPNTF